MPEVALKYDLTESYDKSIKDYIKYKNSRQAVRLASSSRWEQIVVRKASYPLASHRILERTLCIENRLGSRAAWSVNSDWQREAESEDKFLAGEI